MNLQVIYNISKDLEIEKESIQMIADENISKKMDSYLKKYDKKEDAKWSIKLTFDKNNKWTFSWKINAIFDGESYYFERDNYENLDDLVNHLFDLLKEKMSEKK